LSVSTELLVAVHSTW